MMGHSCWVGFALVGSCTETSTPRCLKIGVDISVEEAKFYPAGSIQHA